MNPKERVLTMINGELPDMVPVLPVVDGYHAPKVLGIPNWECFLNWEKMTKALIAALKHYKYDGVVAEMGLGRGSSILGCKVEVEGKDVPLFVDHLIKVPEDLSKLEVPDPWSEDKMEPVIRLVKEIGSDYFVVGGVRAPFETACIVRGYTNLLCDIYDDPDFVHKIIGITQDITLAIGEALIEAGVDAVVVRDSLASSSVISPEHYGEFAFPYEKKVIKKFEKKVPTILHICKNSAPILNKMVNTGARVLEIDSPVNLKEAKERVGEKVVLKGNLDSVEVLERGSVDAVKKAVQACMEAAKKDGGYILSSGDSIPRGAPLENIRIMVKSGRKFGGY